MSEILHIQGKRIDLIPDTISRTIQINNIGDAKDRQSSLSNTIKIPKTANNIRAFDFLGINGSLSRHPYKSLKCDYSVDGVPLIPNGYAVVKETSEHYEVVLYDGVIDLAERIKGKKLSDLDYSDINHYTTPDTYLDSLNNTEGYIYAMAEFGRGLNSVQYQVPSVFVSTIWNKILSQVGVSYFGEFFNNEDFNSEVITPPIGYEVKKPYQIITPIGGKTSYPIYVYENSNAYFTNRQSFKYTSTAGNSTYSLDSNGVFTFHENTQIKIEMSLDYVITSGRASIEVVLNSGIVDSIGLRSELTSLNKTLNISVNNGDKLEFRLRGQSMLIPPFEISYNAGIVLALEKNTATQTAGMIQFEKIIGDMTQMEFLSDVMQRYGLIIRKSKNNDVYEFKQLEELLNDKDNAIDWSEKLTRITSESYTPQVARINEAKYKYPDEILIPTHDGILPVDNENLKASKILFNSPYTVNNDSFIYAGMDVYTHKIWEIENNEIKPVENKIKLFRISRSESRTFFLSYFDNVNPVEFTGEMPFLSLENMSMQYVLNKCYNGYKLLLDNYKEVGAGLNLNPLDIFSLDLFKLIYLKQTGNYYYINNIHNKPNQISKAELIQLNGFTTNKPPISLGENVIYLNNNSSRSLGTRVVLDGYQDYEFDEPVKIKFLDGNGGNIKLKQDGIEIIANQEVNIIDWDISIEDDGANTSAHEQKWEFQIMDAGSLKYGYVKGSLTAKVSEHINLPPVADAGSNQTKNIDVNGPQFGVFALVSGSASSDPNNDPLTFQWNLIDSPMSSTATLQSGSTQSAVLRIPETQNNIGIYTLKLTVTDKYELTDTSTMTVTVQQLH